MSLGIDSQPPRLPFKCVSPTPAPCCSTLQRAPCPMPHAQCCSLLNFSFAAVCLDQLAPPLVVVVVTAAVCLSPKIAPALTLAPVHGEFKAVAVPVVVVVDFGVCFETDAVQCPLLLLVNVQPNRTELHSTFGRRKFMKLRTSNDKHNRIS